MAILSDTKKKVENGFVGHVLARHSKCAVILTRFVSYMSLMVSIRDLGPFTVK